MKIKFAGITDEQKALAAVQQDGFALQYVIEIELFKRVALALCIEVEI